MYLLVIDIVLNLVESILFQLHDNVFVLVNICIRQIHIIPKFKNI